MSEAISYQNPVHLAVLIEGRLKKDRPEVAVIPTSNPGEEDEHYICLVLRTYHVNPTTGGKSFLGYVTFRMNEVKYKPKAYNFPVFSSIECRKSDFTPFQNAKVHFNPAKTIQDYPTETAEALKESMNAQGSSANPVLYRENVGKRMLEKAYQAILDMVDGKLQ